METQSSNVYLYIKKPPREIVFVRRVGRVPEDHLVTRTSQGRGERETKGRKWKADRVIEVTSNGSGGLFLEVRLAFKFNWLLALSAMVSHKYIRRCLTRAPRQQRNHLFSVSFSFARQLMSRAMVLDVTKVSNNHENQDFYPFMHTRIARTLSFFNVVDNRWSINWNFEKTALCTRATHF